ncbi:MAG: hypothetical protein OSB29_01560 [Verrucomicrobiota bacterium]|nr:hypothetical protein [Verrucomicrobiota bacterium]
MPLAIISPPYGISRLTASFPLARHSGWPHCIFLIKKLIACLVVVLLLGCIEFEKQTLVFRHYPETDTLVIWQHYEGIHGEDHEYGLSETEREQLHSVVNGQRTFFFANWIFEYNTKGIDRFIKEGEGEIKEGIEPKAKADVVRQSLGWMKLLKKSVTIENDPFYLNEQKRLCATQQVTLRNAGTLIRELNVIMRSSYLQGENIFRTFEEGDPNIELLEKSALAKMEFLTLKGQQLRFQLPLTEKNFCESDVDDLKLFRKAGVPFEHKNNLLTITAGKVKAAETSVSMQFPKVAFQPNATETVSKRYGLAKDFNPAKARANFLKESGASYLKK